MPGQKTIRGRGKSVVPLPKAGGVVPPLLSGAMLESEDYMNEGSEGMFHTYSNHKELLEQVRHVLSLQVGLVLSNGCMQILNPDVISQ